MINNKHRAMIYYVRVKVDATQ